KRPEHGVKRLVGANRDVVDLRSAAAGANSSYERLNLALVCSLQAPRFGHDLTERFESLEHGDLLKRKIEFGRVEDVEHDDVVPAMPQVFEASEHRLDVVEQITQDYDDAASAEPLG